MPSNATAELHGRGDGSTGAAPLMLCPTPRNALLRGERRLQRPEPKGSASRWNTGTGDTGAVAIAQAWHPFLVAARRAQQTAAAKPPLLRTQSCKSHALALQISCPEGVGPPQADPDPSHVHHGARGSHGPAKPASPEPPGAGGRCCPPLRRLRGVWPPAPPASPISSRRPRPGPSLLAARLRPRLQERAEK